MLLRRGLCLCVSGSHRHNRARLFLIQLMHHVLLTSIYLLFYSLKMLPSHSHWGSTTGWLADWRMLPPSATAAGRTEHTAQTGGQVHFTDVVLVDEITQMNEL